MNEVYYKPTGGFSPGSVFYRIHRRSDNGLVAVICNLEMRFDIHNGDLKEYIFVRDSKGKIFTFASKKIAKRYLRLWFCENEIDFAQREAPIISDELLAESSKSPKEEDYSVDNLLPIPKKRRTFHPSQICCV